VDVDDEPEALDEPEPEGLDEEDDPEGGEEDEELMSGSEVSNVRVADIPSRCDFMRLAHGVLLWRMSRLQQSALKSQYFSTSFFKIPLGLGFHESDTGRSEDFQRRANLGARPPPPTESSSELWDPVSRFAHTKGRC
jgi:hypothetical protein